MPKESKFAGSFEKQKSRESEPSLKNSALCFRVFKIGSFNEKSLAQFKNQISAIGRFKQFAEARLEEKSPSTIIITNSDIPPEGRAELENSNLKLIFADSAKAKRRAELGKRLIGEKSASKGEFSYSDMLNAPRSQESFSDSIFISSDLANKPEALLEQILGMKKIKDQYEKTNPGKLAIVGSAVEVIHDIELIHKIIEGSQNLNMENLSKIFHNNALSIVDKNTKFSGITDNYLSGTVEINGQAEPIGGDEDFLYGLKEILYRQKDYVLLIEPHIEGERVGEIKGVESKYARRPAVYKLYARRAIEQARKRKSIDLTDGELTDEQLDDIIGNLMDDHLFFARLNSENQPEIALTSRQLAKRVKAPF